MSTRPASSAPLAADPFDTSSLSFVRRAVAADREPSFDDIGHALAVADARFDLSCADVAAERGVERPAAVVARYVTEFGCAS